MKNFKLKNIYVGLTLMVVALFAVVSCQDDVQDMNSSVNKVEGSANRVAASKPLDVIGKNPDEKGNSYITKDMTLYNDTTYVLNGFVRVVAGATLYIQPGTTIIGREDDGKDDLINPGTLIVERGAKIIATGVSNNPIVFTGEKKQVGSWGGVILLGRATNNLAGGLGEIEGLPVPGTPQGFYGADLAKGESFDDNDNSGTLQYVRIEYAGNSIDEVNGNETNGLTLGSVGRGTTIDHVMVAFGNDDAFEFFGGTVDAKYLIGYRCRDDNFDTDQGYSGRIQFGISVAGQNDDITVKPVNGFESNGDIDDDRAPGSKLTDATFSNFTVIGPIQPQGGSISEAYRVGALIRDKSELDVFNSIIVGYPEHQVQLENPEDFGKTVIMEGVTAVYPTYSGFISEGTNVAADVFTASGLNNELANAFATAGRRGTMVALTGLSTSAWSTTSPNFEPIIEKKSDFTNSLVQDGFFDQVDFRGAFGKADPANAGWNINGAWVNWTKGE